MRALRILILIGSSYAMTWCAGFSLIGLLQTLKHPNLMDFILTIPFNCCCAIWVWFLIDTLKRPR